MIIFNDGAIFDNIEPIFGAQRNMRNSMRESLEITIINSDYYSIKSKFVDGMKFSIKRDSQSELIDKSDYEIVGDIIDKQNGTFVVYACHKTDIEKLEEENAKLLLDLGDIINE